MAGIPVLILGRSGTGKSASLRNFKSDEVSVINVNGKRFPFQSKLERVVVTDNSQKIILGLKKSTSKVIVIDDSQYIMANEFMRNALCKGFDKYNLIAKNFWDIIYAVKDLPDDRTVYFLHHEETGDDGIVRAKTQGKMIDNHICLEGMFGIVLRTFVKDGVYGFTTQNDGQDTVKSPMGMFPEMEIDNDLYEVDKIIRKYYGLPAIRAEKKATVAK